MAYQDHQSIASVAVTPMGKPRMTQRDKWAKRPVVQRYFEYRDALRRALPDFELPALGLELTFYLPMPTSWSTNRRSTRIGAPHDQTPDIDNLCKGFMDAWTEDKHVAELHAYKYWSEEGGIDVRLAGISRAGEVSE